MGVLPQLPRELITKILALALETEPICAFKLFVPEWHLCPARHGELDSILRTTRFDTYTVRGPDQGDISTTFSHKGEDCIYLPVMWDPNGWELPFDEHMHRELVKEWSGRAMMVFGQKAGNLGSLMEPDITKKIRESILLRHPSAVATLPFRDLGADHRQWIVPPVPGRTLEEEEEAGTAIYLYDRVRHVMLNTDPTLWSLTAAEFRHPDDELSGVSEETLDAVQVRLEEEQFAHLFARWHSMPRLESLFLDVRQYTKHSFEDVEEKTMRDAAEGLAGMELDLLVVAGLRSYASYPGPEEMVEEDLKAGDSGGLYMGGGSRIRLFGRAVKVGGRLILVDKRMDTLHRLPFRRSDNCIYSESCDGVH